jgi:hypothetical protein
MLTMKEYRAYALFILFSILSGCSTTATLYPINGPLSKMQPLPVLTATADGIMGNTGNISLTLPDGEFCKGRWSSIAPMDVNYSTALATSTTTNGMSSVWATVYGSGFSVNNLAGVNKGEAVLVGDKGTVIQVEFYTGSGTANGAGVAKDNKGNFFKVLF